ncbi:MAG: hypothetical protein IPP71_00440 [Bacteroidetes bacterium]|nr:hypothetical protein [Bacteroidota bacterium]
MLTLTTATTTATYTATATAAAPNIKMKKISFLYFFSKNDLHLLQQLNFYNIFHVFKTFSGLIGGLFYCLLLVIALIFPQTFIGTASISNGLWSVLNNPARFAW